MLLDNAEVDIKLAKYAVSPEGNPTNDELMLGAAAYHVQQAIEKVLKYILQTEAGMTESDKGYKTHNISMLIYLVDSKTTFPVPEKLVEMSSLITDWEATTRYAGSSVGTRNNIIEAMDLYKELKTEIQERKKDSANRGEESIQDVKHSHV